MHRKTQLSSGHDSFADADPRAMVCEKWIGPALSMSEGFRKFLRP